MISSSAVPNLAWTVATPLSGPSAGATNSALNASADSFQNIFANAAALPQFASASPVLSAASTVGSNMGADWSSQANNDSETASDENAVSAPASDYYSDSEPASATDSNLPLTSWQSSNPISSDSTTGLNSSSEAAEQPSGSTPSSSSVASGNSDSAKAKSQAAARNSPANTKQATTKADKKLDQHSQAQQAGTNVGATSGASSRAAVLPDTAVSPRAADHALADRRADVQQTASITDSTTKTASPDNAFPGSGNPLTGAAFALHITPAGNHSEATQKTVSTTSATVNAVQGPPILAARATPADNALTDSAAVAVGVVDPASLQVSATLMAAAGAGRPRQVSALGPSLDSADATPWSAPTTSPALLNDQAEPAESVTAAAPVAEIDMEDPSGSAQPVRTLQLQLGGTGDQRVDLRLVEHAGGLSVSVRASDSSLTRGLQDNLPELSSRLAAEHYQTQAWLPAAGQTSAGGHSSGSFEQSPDRGGGRQSSQGGSSSGGQGNPQEGRQQDQPPAWWRQLATLDGAAASASTSVQSSTPSSAESPLTKQ